MTILIPPYHLMHNRIVLALLDAKTQGETEAGAAHAVMAAILKSPRLELAAMLPQSPEWSQHAAGFAAGSSHAQLTVLAQLQDLFRRPIELEEDETEEDQDA